MKLKDGSSRIIIKKNKNARSKSERYYSSIKITKSRINKYPYMGLVAMLIGSIIFLVIGGAKSIMNLWINSF